MIIVLTWIAIATYVLHRLDASDMIVSNEAERISTLNSIVGAYELGLPVYPN